MMMSEFIERTGFEPTCEEYAEIEDAYYSFSGSKDEFCKQFVENGGEKQVYTSRVQKIARLKSEIVEMEKDFMQELQKKEQEITRLTTALEREQEWKPYESEANVKQAEYEELLNCSGTRELSDDEAASMIADEFGFDRSRIAILHEVDTWEINRHRQCRRSGTIPRKALFNAWDWNYVAFRIKSDAGIDYEMHNGHLQMHVE